MQPTKEIENSIELFDSRVNIKPFDLTYAEEHFRGEDAEQVKWLSGGKGTLEGVKNWILKNQKYWQEDGPVFNFAVFAKDNNQLVGMVEANTDYHTVEGIEPGDANVSYGLYPFARGKGYVTSVVNLITNFLKDKGIKRAIIRVSPNNEASLKVPLRYGFENSGTITLKNNETLVCFTKKL